MRTNNQLLNHTQKVLKIATVFISGGNAGDELVPVLVLCPGNPVLENFPLRKPAGLSKGGDVAHCAFILDHHRVPQLLGIWMR